MSFHIALNNCLPNSSYIIRKGGSESSSSGGTESDKLSFTKDNIIRTINTARKDRSSYEQASPTESETHLPLIQHSVSNGWCGKELKISNLFALPEKNKTSTYCFARASLHVTDFNNRNKFLPSKLLKQGIPYHKLRKAFSKFYRRYFELSEKYYVSLKKLMQQGICNPQFYDI